MNKLTFLGVWMTPDVGETVSFIVDISKGTHVLIDCGTNLVGSMMRCNIDPMDITHIIVTHSHGDHISGLPTYLFYRFLIAPGILGKEAQKLEIIGSKATIQSVKEYIKVAYGAMVDNPLIKFVEVNISDMYKIDSAEFHFFATKHQPETVGFCTNINEKKVVYSADTGISEEIVSYAKDADILIHDVVGTSKYSMLSGSHTLCNEISPLLNKYHVKNFYPVHRLSVYKDDVDEYISELKTEYDGNLVVPNDGDIISLS